MIQEEEEHKVAENIHESLQNLNSALERAYELGLIVKLEITEFTEIGRKNTKSRASITVSRSLL